MSGGNGGMRGGFGGGDEAVSFFPRRGDWEFRYVEYNTLYGQPSGLFRCGFTNGSIIFCPCLFNLCFL